MTCQRIFGGWLFSTQNRLYNESVAIAVWDGEAMIDISDIKQVVQITTDAQGQAVAQLPLALWQELVAHIENQPSQYDQIHSLLQQWETEPDNTPDEWGDDFQAFWQGATRTAPSL